MVRTNGWAGNGVVMEMRSAPPFAAVIFCAVAACAGDAPPRRASSAPKADLPVRATYTRDSAGVEILEFPLPVKNLPLVMSIDSIPLLDLGGRRENPQHNLDQPEVDQFALQLTGPRYLVKDHNNIKLFDSQNLHVVTMGVGHLQQVNGICVTDADTVLALEEHRVSVFTINGKFVRSSPVLAGSVAPSGCFHDGTLLVLTDRRRDSTAIALFAENARRIRRDGRDVRMLGAVQSGTSSPAIFMRANNAVFRDLLVTGDGREAEIRIFRISGRLRRVIRWNESTELVSPNLLRAFVENTVAADKVDALLERTFTTAHPNSLPVYYELQVDEAGRIWMLDYPQVLIQPQPPMLWTVFDSTGAPLGRVEQPSVAAAIGMTSIVWIGSDRVLLRWTDKEQIVHLTYHRLR